MKHNAFKMTSVFKTTSVFKSTLLAAVISLSSGEQCQPIIN